MKNLSLIVLLILPLKVFSQDTLALFDQSKIDCSVLSINSTTIEYIKNQKTTPVYLIPTGTVAYIQFENGKIDSLNEFRLKAPIPVSKPYLSEDSVSNFAMGMQDGFNRYEGRSIKTATVITTIILPPAGLATAVIASGIPPNTDYLRTDYDDLNYKAGFSNGARIKKRKQAWGGFGLGMGILAGITLLIAGTSN